MTTNTRAELADEIATCLAKRAEALRRNAVGPGKEYSDAVDQYNAANAELARLIDLHADTILSALRGQGEGWQAIETLDVETLEDGQEMLVLNDRGMFVGAWEPDWSIEHGFRGGWWMISDGKDIERALRGDVPTHFRMLPAPPSQAGDDDGR